MSKTTYYQKNRDVLLNKSKEYDRNNRGLMQERANNKYKLLSEDEKEIIREYHGNRYHNMTDEQKQIFKKYQEKHRQAKNKHKKINIII